MQAPDHLKQSLLEQSFAGLYSKDFDAKNDLRKIAVVNQTTLLRNETLRIIDYLKQAYEGIFGFENLHIIFGPKVKMILCVTRHKLTKMHFIKLYKILSIQPLWWEVKIVPIPSNSIEFVSKNIEYERITFSQNKYIKFE